MLKTLECIIALFLIFSFLFILFKEERIEVQRAELLIKSLSTLESLDMEGELRDYAILNDSKSIEEKISEMVQPFDVRVLICNQSCKYPSYENVIFSFSYIISGKIDNFNPRKILVYVME